MTDIVLKVPDGGNCLGCLFLDIDYAHNMAECKLFEEKLSSQMEYGGIDESTILKTDSCPVSDNT